jgi:TRAP-type C4-dicarboxylate transport system substrate-binding protein
MKTRFLCCAVFALAMVAMAPNPAAAADPIQLSYANFPPAPTFPCVQMERWKTEVEKRTSGLLAVKTFPGGTLLDAKQMMDGVIDGVADIGCLCMAYQPGRFVVTNALSLPLDLPNARVASLVLWDVYAKYQPEEFAKVKVLTMFCTAPSNIMSKKPVRTLADIQGMPLRASGGAVDLLKAWGANCAGMPMSETPEALQKGVVDGLFSSLEVLKDFKFAELCKYATMVETPVYPFAVVMNLNSWNKLPKEAQKVFDDMRVEQADWTGTYMDKHVVESIELSKQNHGLEVIELSAAEKAKWDERLAPITTKAIADMSAKGVPAEKLIADIKALTKKYQ